MARILVVEDEPELREIIALELNDVGHQTSEAGNGQEALSLALESRPEIIISDITMPVMNGYQFFRSLREKHPELRHTPFIFLSALADKNDMLKGYRLGVDDYITKPIDFDLLVARIEARLSLAAARGALSFEGGDPADPGDDDGANRPAAAEMDSSPTQNQDSLMAAMLQTVSLEQIRLRCGDRWQEVRDRILRNAELVIQSHLDDDDIFGKLASDDFVITFAKLSNEEAAHKIQVIKDELWERLFGDTNDEVLSEVLSELHELEMSEEESAKTEGFVGRIHEKIKTASKKINNGSERKITRIFEYEDIFVSDIQDYSENKVKLTRIDFSYKIGKAIDVLMENSKFHQDLLSELNSTFLKRLMDKISTIRKSALVIPIRFSMAKSDNRNHVENIFKSMDEKYQKFIIIERTQLPNRLSVVADEMRPFSVGSQIQMAELRGASQANNFNLRKNRIGMISMDYDDVVYSYHKGISEIVDNFRNFGGRLYIKNIPEGKLVDVQEYKPDLIGIRT